MSERDAIREEMIEQMLKGSGRWEIRPPSGDDYPMWTVLPDGWPVITAEGKTLFEALANAKRKLEQRS